MVSGKIILLGPFKEQISQTRKHDSNLDSETARNEFDIWAKEMVILCINGWENRILSVSKKSCFCICNVTVTFSLLATVKLVILVNLSPYLIPGTSRDITGK